MTLIQQWRACGADAHSEGEVQEPCPWRADIELAEDDKRLLGNDCPPFDETFIQTRWVTPAFRLEEATKARAVVDELLDRIQETKR